MTTGDPLVVDSHAFIWYVQASSRLSDAARQAMDAATGAEAPLLISAATLVELVYLVEKGTFTEADVDSLLEILDATDSWCGPRQHKEWPLRSATSGAVCVRCRASSRTTRALSGRPAGAA